MWTTSLIYPTFYSFIDDVRFNQLKVVTDQVWVLTSYSWIQHMIHSCSLTKSNLALIPHVGDPKVTRETIGQCSNTTREREREGERIERDHISSQNLKTLDICVTSFLYSSFYPYTCDVRLNNSHLKSNNLPIICEFPPHIIGSNKDPTFAPPPS